MENHNALGLILGGLAFSMYGMTLASDHLQKLASNRVRHLLNSVSGKQFITIGIGIILTIFLQSSGAVTSMLVTLGSAGVVTLRQVMGIILGSAVGSTFTVQLISFNITQFGLPIFVLGFWAYFLFKKKTLKSISAIFLGFGMLFFGLEMMGKGTTIIRDIPLMMEIFVQLKTNPMLSLIITTLFTALVHSSAVVIGLAMTLANADIINFNDAIYWVYGANIGTTATALMASVGSNYVGRQVAWAHFFYKVGAVLMFYFFTEQIATLIAFDQNVIRNIANAHLLLNIVSVVIFYPFINLAAKQIEKMFPQNENDREFGTEFINVENFEYTELAYAQAIRETSRMGDIVIEMIKDSIDLFQSDDPELFEKIQKRDNQLDILQKEIKMFLAKLSDSGGRLGKSTVRLITFVSELESSGDVIDHSIKDLARKMHNLKLEFSPEGWSEIKKVHMDVLEVAKMSLSCFQLRDSDLARRVIERKRNIRKEEKKLWESHIERLKKGMAVSINTSSVHMDLIGDYRRIVGLMCNHAYDLSDQDKKGV